MSDHHTEDRLRDALGAVRDQSVSRAMAPELPPAGEDLVTVHVLEDRRQSRTGRAAPWLAAAAALVLVVAGSVVFAGRSSDDRTSVTASNPDGGLSHAAAVARVVAECARYQAAVPAEAAPTTDPPALMAWLAVNEQAVRDARDAVADLDTSEDGDRRVMEKVANALARQQEALEAAQVAAASGDELEAVRQIDRARSYESIAGFELAQWGAVTCDERGVTRPTR